MGVSAGLGHGLRKKTEFSADRAGGEDDDVDYRIRALSPGVGNTQSTSVVQSCPFPSWPENVYPVIRQIVSANAGSVFDM